MTAVERVEIVRGPNSFFFGSSALAGAINIVTRRGTPGAARWEAEFETGDASLRRGGATVAGGGGRVGYFAALGWEEEGRLREPGRGLRAGIRYGRSSATRAVAARRISGPGVPPCDPPGRSS